MTTTSTPGAGEFPLPEHRAAFEAHIVSEGYNAEHWLQRWPAGIAVHSDRYIKDWVQTAWEAYAKGRNDESAALRAQAADSEVSRLRNLAATCYAGLGAECNLPEAWLDALNAAANGEPFDTENLLPFTYQPEAAEGEQSAAHAAGQEPDMRAICEALGFDPTNHHNAAKCPYCRPTAHPLPVAGEEVRGAYKSCRMDDGRCGLCGGDWSVCGCDGMLRRAHAAPAGEKGEA